MEIQIEDLSINQEAIELSEIDIGMPYKPKLREEVIVSPSTELQEITPQDNAHELTNVTVGAVDSSIDGNIKAINIREGVTILGVEGNLAPDKPDQEKTVTPTTSEQNVVADTGFELSKVTVGAVTSAIDENIQVGNIRKDVSILGVVGNFVGADPNNISDENVKAYDMANDLINGGNDILPSYDGVAQQIMNLYNKIANGGVI